MSKKTLILAVILVLAITFGGAVWVAKEKSKKMALEKQNKERTAQMQNKQDEPKQLDNFGQNSDIDTSNWKMYRNEEYGFEVRYPEDAEVETFYSNGIGSPVDCKKTPEKCLNFSMKIQNKKGENLITMETFSKELPIKNNTNEENSGSLTFHRGGKTVSGNNYTKNNSYFPMFSSCFTVVSFPGVNLRKNDGFHFFKFYEIQGQVSLDDAKISCAKENKDVVFDEIIESFRIF